MSLIILNVDEVRRTLSASGGAFVVHDKEVDIVRFAINSGFADITLDEHSALRVMYQRPGESQVRAQTLVYYDTDGLRSYYDWHLLSADLAEKGTLTVALCILRADSEVEEWHTTPCQVRVLDTIHTDDSDEADETITPTVSQRVAVLETMIQRVASGAPIVVASTSAMTDTDQIYVLSTDGNWYYHNGTTWVSGGTYGAVATDTTLTQANVPADAKAVGDEIDDLKEDLDIVTGNTVVSLTNGKYIATNGDTANIDSLVSNPTYAYVVIDCAEGDVFTVTGTGGNTPRLYAFLGAESEGARPILMKSNSGITLTNNYITAPTGAEKLVINVNVNYDYEIIVGKSIVNAWDDIKANSDKIDDIKKVILFPNLANPAEYTVGYKTNAGRTGPNTAYKYTGKIAVAEGDTLYLTSAGRYLCAFDQNGSVKSESGLSTGFTSYDVPSGVASVQITFSSENADTFMVTKYAEQEYIPYGTPVINRASLPDDPVVINDRKLNYIRTSGDLSANDYLYINKKMPVKNGSVIQFSGNVSGEFTGIEIGYTNDPTDTDATHFKIDATKFYRVTTSPSESAHGLTISGNISVTITQTFTHLLVDVIANGIKYHSGNGWSPLNKGIYVKALSAMTDCVLSWTAEKARKDIVIFGDSYVSYGETRWPYYLDNDSKYIDGVQILGYSGEGSADGYVNFTDYMPYSNAKYCIWAYGMNDHDTASAPNATWKEKIDAVIAYCESHAITPILCTIPNVPSYSNQYKNAYVRSFIGMYPVIDFAKAVGSDISSSWYDGYLSTDNVHPTALGAKALYNRAIADFPQLCVDN